MCFLVRVIPEKPCPIHASLMLPMVFLCHLGPDKEQPHIFGTAFTTKVICSACDSAQFPPFCKDTSHIQLRIYPSSISPH